MTAPSDNPIAAVMATAIRQIGMLEVQPIRGCADAIDLMRRKTLLEQFGKVIDNVIYQIMAECADHTIRSIDRSYYKSILSDALEDRGVTSTLHCAADELREAEADAAERPLRTCFDPDSGRRISIK